METKFSITVTFRNCHYQAVPQLKVLHHPDYEKYALPRLSYTLP
jgi:hypothetical protein